MECQTVWTAEHLGCWVDGAYGEEHEVAKLITMLEVLLVADDPCQWDALALILDLEMESEDMLDWRHYTIIDAVELLQAHTEEGLMWDQETGDLCLCEETELED